MKRETKEEGITLIALVITIIVMLILVLVTINITLNEGLITKAQEAKTETQDIQVREQGDLNNITTEITDIVENGTSSSTEKFVANGDWIIEETELKLTETDTGGENIMTVTGYTGSETNVTIPNYCSDGVTPILAIGIAVFGNEEEGETKDQIIVLNIPDGIKYIMFGAFSYIETITTLTIPASVQSIGDYALEGTAALANLTVDANNNYFKSENNVLFSKDGADLIYYSKAKSNTEYIVPTGVTTIGIEAFSECTTLTSVTIPNTIQTISGDAAFSECTCQIIIQKTSMDGITYDTADFTNEGTTRRRIYNS